MKRLVVIGVVFMLFMPVVSIDGTINHAIFLSENRYNDGRTLYVGGEGPGNYSKIQDAINDAKDGDKIVVYPKVYKENVVINKRLILTGLNFPIIDACGKGAAINITANNCYIKGFNVTGVKENSTNHAGIKICSSENVIMNNIIWKCESNGMYLKNSEKNNISNNVIVYTKWYSVYLHNSSNNTFFNNTISSKISGDGIIIGSSSNNLFIKNWIYKNNIGIITSFGKGSYYNNFTGNLIEDNIFGMFLGSKNTAINNIFTNNYGGGLRISGSNNVIKNNKFKNCGIMIWNGVNVIENNTANGKPINSYIDEKEKTVPEDAAQVILINCTDFLIQNITFSDVDCAIALLNSSHNLIRNCTVKLTYKINYPDMAVYLYRSNNNTILDNDFSHTLYGINLQNSHDNIVANNILEHSIFHGVGMSVSSRNLIKENNISITREGGISLEKSEYNRICYNRISLSGETGIMIENSGGNCIFGNYLMKNEVGIYIEFSYLNIIKNNNFIDNQKDAFFGGSYLNTWIRNYWDTWRLPLPKPIFGLQGVPWSIIGIPWFNFDWMPRMKPYEEMR